MHFGRSPICLIAILLLFIRPGISQTAINYKLLYERAEKLSNALNHTDQTDEAALKMYLQVLTYLKQANRDDQFLFKADVSTGAFLQVLGREKESINFFKSALALKPKLTRLKDSVLFRPLVYCGNAYYTLDKPDTAESFYKRASAIADRFPNVSELERLYNTLGVISYSKGNYSESIPYYQKAISTLKRAKNYDNTLFVVYQSNLASAFRKLRQYHEALNIYLGLLPYKVQTDQILHNIGATYLGMNDDDKAAAYLGRVSYENQKKLNDLASAYLHKKDYNKAAYYLVKAKELNVRVNKARKNSDYGITLKYWGDLCYQQKQMVEALSYFQESIANLLTDFTSTDLYNNPTNFRNAFNGMDLLEVLSAKAQAFKALYSQTHKLQDLEASLNASTAFYALANYIARFYETDESRLVISNRKYISRDEPISICLQLFRLTGDQKFVEKAFALDEENKASLMSLYLEEANQKQQAAPPQLLKEENNLKEAITRLSLRDASENDTTRLRTDKNQINDLTVKLLRIQQEINQKTGFTLESNTGFGGSIADLQKIIPSNGAVLSYHVSQAEIIYFVITRNDFSFFKSAVKPDFFNSINELYHLAGERERNNLSRIKALSQELYKKLIEPAGEAIENKKQLVIIPDNTLNFLPFELLMDDNGNRLLNNHTVIYNYSCRILRKSNHDLLNKNMTRLGMAPFVEKPDGADPGHQWSELPASGLEVRRLMGTALIGRNATKEAFLKKAGKFNIIHLATHAMANDLHPDQSFIAFYPVKQDSDLTYKLFMPEIYNLQLNQTRLIVLSACESGAGELAQGEGVMSLSRAFSYSGCDNIITSMWKADDQSTAYISGKLYAYLAKGHTIAEALRQAKLDYIGDMQIGPAQKLPGYWAHLRLIGTFEKSSQNNTWIWYLAILLVAGLIILIKKGRPNDRRPRN